MLITRLVLTFAATIALTPAFSQQPLPKPAEKIASFTSSYNGARCIPYDEQRVNSPELLETLKTITDDFSKATSTLQYEFEICPLFQSYPHGAREEGVSFLAVITSGNSKAPVPLYAETETEQPLDIVFRDTTEFVESQRYSSDWQQIGADTYSFLQTSSRSRIEENEAGDVVESVYTFHKFFNLITFKENEAYFLIKDLPVASYSWSNLESKPDLRDQLTVSDISSDSLTVQQIAPVITSEQRQWLGTFTLDKR